MMLAAALIYWVIVGLWTSTLATVCVAFARNPRIFGTARLLLSVVLIDTTRNIIENIYFGMYFGSQYGLFPTSVALVLGSPGYLILPKVMNVVAGSAVLGLLLWRWLPSASKERENADATLKTKETALQHEVEERQRLTFYDHLTGLPNRTSLSRDLASPPRSRAGEQIGGLSLAVVDLDRFKDINDTLGHPIGDKLLRQVALRLLGASTESRVYRLAEDVFVLLYSCADPLVATKFIEQALEKLSARFDLDGQQVFITASAGLAIAPAHGSTPDDLLANAELALYDAKESGGRSVRLFFSGLRARAQQRRQLQSELRRACALDELVLHYQPQVRAGDAAIVAAEALLRWHHPVHGLLGPGAFIDALAESAVAVEAGRWILESACAAAASWREKGLGPIQISVNLFPAHFRCGSLEQDVDNALMKTGLPAEALELEITENIALGYDETTLGLLERLRARGVGIAFDDFGTGYASLSSVTRYALTQIKIDRSFIQKIEAQSSERDTAVVRSILAMAHSLRLEVVAEGVETPFQADFLREQGCQKLQGFLFAKPLPASDFEKLCSPSVQRKVAPGS